VGILPSQGLTRARASGPGKLVLPFGATTGRDGIGGASVLASQELAEADADKRPSVQIGDPFTGKKLIEASVELVERGLVESLQDCGAAGLASALAEMARDGAGIDVALDRVPLREPDLEPWEIVISESQERMVAVVRPQMRDAVEAVLRRWELEHAVIGEVTDTGELRCSLEGAVLRLRPSMRGLAVSLDGPGPVARLDPRAAGALAVLEAARNVACAGGEPLGLTDCLNFGNPEKPEIAWELAEAIEGIASAAEALGIPVVSGNVSLYNETDGRAIPPTPVVGCVGLV